MSPFKLSSKEMWPILGRIYTNPVAYKPFVNLAYYGYRKPSCLDFYLKNLVEELNQILRSDIIIKSVKMKAKLMCFICNEPARSFVKNIKGHMSYFSCEQCCYPGYYKNKRVLFLPSTDYDKRNDYSFRIQRDSNHHIRKPPLLQVESRINI